MFSMSGDTNCSWNALPVFAFDRNTRTARPGNDTVAVVVVVATVVVAVVCEATCASPASACAAAHSAHTMSSSSLPRWPHGGCSGRRQCWHLCEGLHAPTQEAATTHACQRSAQHRLSSSSSSLLLLSRCLFFCFDADGAVVMVVVATEEGVVVDDDVDGVVERDVANNDTTTVNKHAASKFCSNNVCKSYIHKVSSSSSSFVTIMTKGEKTRIDQLYELLIVLLTDYL